MAGQKKTFYKKKNRDDGFKINSKQIILNSSNSMLYNNMSSEYDINNVSLDNITIILYFIILHPKVLG